MPRSLLWGCLSRAAVESFVDRAATATNQSWRQRYLVDNTCWGGGGFRDDDDLTECSFPTVDMAKHAHVDVPHSCCVVHRCFMAACTPSGQRSAYA